MNKALIIRALTLLADYASEEKIELELCIYGGAAMMLAYGNRQTTKDVDAIIKSTANIKHLIQKVAITLDLHDEWLNEDVRIFVAEKESTNELQLKELEHTNLKITKPTAAYLLAMKCNACRKPLPGFSPDYGDISFLVKKMNITSIQEIQSHIDRYFYDAPLPIDTKFELQQILDNA